jgi:hypothetical protein
MAISGRTPANFAVFYTRGLVQDNPLTESECYLISMQVYIMQQNSKDPIGKGGIQ